MNLPIPMANLSLISESFLPLGDYTENFWFPEQASSFAENVDWTFNMILWISLIFFVVIVALLAWFSIRYWKPKGGKAESQVSHHTPSELAWSIGPSFLLVYMFTIGAFSFLDMRKEPEGSNEIAVDAYKWGWTMDYGNGVYHPELHLLLDEPTMLTMRSKDVIHSLFIPAFRAKKDIVPGRYNYMWFQPTVVSKKVSPEELAEAKAETGSDPWDYDKYQFTPEGFRFYDLYCTEYCGKSHSEMQTVVVVHETLEELDAWIQSKKARGPGVKKEDWGKKLYSQRGCASCHSIDGSKRVGPSFQNVYGSEHGLTDGSQIKVDPNYIRESILNPKAKIVAGYNPVMPSYKGQLSDDDIDSIIAYLKTLAK
ncbi:MAG: c-type cytochrome [Planctomycetota bacterium]